MSGAADLDVLRGGPLFCCLCQRTLRGAFLDARAPDGRSLFCDRLTWFNCAGCGDPSGHRLCDYCVELHKLESVPDEAGAAADSPRRAWRDCPEALVVARKVMGKDGAPPEIEPVSFNQGADPLRNVIATPVPSRPRGRR